MTTQTAEDLFLRTAPLGEIIADTRARKAAQPPAPIKTTADMFERLAEWAHNNCDDDGLDLVLDVVAAITPHLDADTSALYFEDLMTAVVAHGKAQEGEHPGDVDNESWANQCRDAVEFAAQQLAGA